MKFGFQGQIDTLKDIGCGSKLYHHPQRRKNTANLQTWFGGRYWPKIEEGFVVKNKILLC